ncbi:MAG: hypothetical protein EBZ61_06275 [Micrococcales bacterium]|nr:hypothetical protein [Micrococcales bacterium]
MADCLGRPTVWRHDVDISVGAAVQLARIDADLGVPSIFFVNPRAELYNIESSRVSEQLREIVSLGHEIGLHIEVDEVTVASDSNKLSDQIDCEAATITRVLGKKPACFSFHNPSSATSMFTELSYGGLVNSYSSQVMSKFAYVSDSNGYWRYGDILSSAQKNADRPLQILTHPEWWCDTYLEPRERLFRHVFGDAADFMRRYDSSLFESGRENRTSIQINHDDVSETLKRTFDELF